MKIPAAGPKRPLAVTPQSENSTEASSAKPSRVEEFIRALANEGFDQLPDVHVLARVQAAERQKAMANFLRAQGAGEETDAALWMPSGENHPPPGLPLFHATSSSVWEDLKRTQSLFPASELSKQGIDRRAGEGSLLKPGAPPQSSISFGLGAQGYRAAREHVDQLVNCPDFNPQLFSDEELSRAIHDLTRFIDNSSEDWLMGAPWSKASAQSHLEFLQAEESRRTREPGRPASYPMMLEFSTTEVITSGLAGETRAKSAVPLSQLKHLFVPEENMEDAKAHLAEILGSELSNIVLPLEAADTLALGSLQPFRPELRRSEYLRHALDWLDSLERSKSGNATRRKPASSDLAGG